MTILPDTVTIYPLATPPRSCCHLPFRPKPAPLSLILPVMPDSAGGLVPLCLRGRGGLTEPRGYLIVIPSGSQHCREFRSRGQGNGRNPLAACTHKWLSQPALHSLELVQPWNNHPGSDPRIQTNLSCHSARPNCRTVPASLCFTPLYISPWPLPSHTPQVGVLRMRQNWGKNAS